MCAIRTYVEEDTYMPNAKLPNACAVVKIPTLWNVCNTVDMTDANRMWHSTE